MLENNSKIAFNRFIKRTLLLAVLLLIIDFLLNYFAKDLSHSPARPWLIIFFVLVSNLVFYYQLKASTSKSAQSVNVFLITTGFKLLFFLMIIVVYSLIFRDDAVNFILDFFFLYLIFTSIEVVQIRKFQNSINKK